MEVKIRNHVVDLDAEVLQKAEAAFSYTGRKFVLLDKQNKKVKVSLETIMKAVEAADPKGNSKEGLEIRKAFSTLRNQGYQDGQLKKKNWMIRKIARILHGKSAAAYEKHMSNLEVKYPQVKVEMKPAQVRKKPKVEKLRPGKEIIRIAAELPFNDYKIKLDGFNGPEQPKLVMTGLSERPANLFFDSLFEGSGVTHTRPGSHKLFAFSDYKEAYKWLHSKARDEVFSFTAKGRPLNEVYPSSGLDRNVKFDPPRTLADIFGDKTFEMSFGEIQDILNSQKIYTSPQLPVEFYQAIKKIFDREKIVILPGSDGDPVSLSKFPHVKIQKFLKKVKENPQEYGFEDKKAFKEFSSLSVYEIGCMVVKVEDFHFFLDKEGKIRERKAGEKDAIRLINICGIRGLQASLKTRTKEELRQLMKDSFATQLVAAEKGIVCMVAVGMGIWGGDPEIYWPAFLEAIAESNVPIKYIPVNPNHRPFTKTWKKYKGMTGEEFKGFLAEAFIKYQDNPNALANLKKIVGVEGADIVQLSQALRARFPDETISFVNASDPDVVFANHVGEYTNNLPHGNTTEENYTAIGTNGLCFEALTRIRYNPDRVFQVSSLKEGMGKLSLNDLLIERREEFVIDS